LCGCRVDLGKEKQDQALLRGGELNILHPLGSWLIARSRIL
jgi:hypothetical protein